MYSFFVFQRHETWRYEEDVIETWKLHEQCFYEEWSLSQDSEAWRIFVATFNNTASKASITSPTHSLQNIQSAKEEETLVAIASRMRIDINHKQYRFLLNWWVDAKVIQKLMWFLDFCSQLCQKAEWLLVIQDWDDAFTNTFVRCFAITCRGFYLEAWTIV